ncbi:hypothetical protein C4553_00190 [Candidatus Parcubacteria bacterium]|nr:MAG: hypothetical protein C4553_00190 [Candidatus Parcubacteria bacterium]
MKNIIEVIKADKRIIVFIGIAVVIILGGSIYAYYNSEEKVIERLVKENPRGEEFAKIIADSQSKLNESGLSLKEKIDALLSSAVAKEALGDRKGAIEDYKAVLELNTAHPIARNNLAGLYTLMGRYEDAEYQYLAIIATQPKIFEGYIKLAELYSGYFKEKESLVPAVLSYAIEQNGTQPAFVEKLAQYYYDKQLYVQALEQVERLLQIDPSSEFGKAMIEDIRQKS